MHELAVGILIIIVLLGLSFTFGWQQVVNLRKLRERGQMSKEDYIHFRRQCYRRLFGCGLTGVFALLMAGWFVLFNGPLDQLSDRRDQADAQSVEPRPEEFGAAGK